MSDTFTMSDFYASDGGEENDDVIVDETIDVEPEGESLDEPAAAEAEPGDDEQAPQDSAEPEGQPEKTYLDFSALEGQFARLKVGDEEIEVPATELPQWAMRQADYTRKTQELAQQREQLQFWQTVDQAMKANPAETLAYLQKQFGVDATSVEETDDDDTWVDPVEKAVQQKLEAFQQQLAPVLEYTSRQQAIEYVDTVVKGMQQKYGDDFNVQEVLGECSQRGIEDPNLIEAVYRDMAAERFFAQQQALKTAGAQRQAEDANKRTAAQQAAAATGASGSAAGGRNATAPARDAETPMEAFQMAMRELREQGVIT